MEDIKLKNAIQKFDSTSLRMYKDLIEEEIKIIENSVHAEEEYYRGCIATLKWVLKAINIYLY